MIFGIFMKLPDKIFLSVSSFVIAFSLGTIISFSALSYLFANGYLNVDETPEYVVNFVCDGNRAYCPAEEFCGY